MGFLEIVLNSVSILGNYISSTNISNTTDSTGSSGSHYMDFHNTRTLCIIGGSEARGDGDIRLVKTQVNGGTNNNVNGSF